MVLISYKDVESRRSGGPWFIWFSYKRDIPTHTQTAANRGVGAYDNII